MRRTRLNLKSKRLIQDWGLLGRHCPLASVVITTTVTVNDLCVGPGQGHVPCNGRSKIGKECG